MMDVGIKVRLGLFNELKAGLLKGVEKKQVSFDTCTRINRGAGR